MYRSDLANFPGLQTDRLLIRPLAMGDAADIYQISSDSQVSRFVLWDTHRNIGDSRAMLRQILRQYRLGEAASWGIQLRESGHIIGTIGYVSLSREHACGEVGYSLGRAHWNRGYATEALKAVIAYGMEQMHLNRIEAMFDVDNPASGRVMEKAGMQREGVLRQKLKNKGRFIDVCQYAILSEDYFKQKTRRREDMQP